MTFHANIFPQHTAIQLIAETLKFT